MRIPTTDAARTLVLAMGLLYGCDDGIDCADCDDDTEAPAAPELQLSETELDFGEIELGETYSESLGVGNQGEADLVLSDISVTEPFAARYDDGLTVAGNASAMLFVDLVPTGPGPIQGTLSFTWNDPAAGSEGALVEIPMSATVPDDTGLD
jgi:hypothetical protein